MTADDENSREEQLRRHQTEEAYRALGRYIYEFSRLVFWMRSILSKSFGPSGQQAIELTLGQAGAQQVAEAFFASCIHFGNLTDEETKIARNLYRRVLEVVKQRNDIAHGDWWIGYAAIEDEQIAPATLVRTKPMRKEGSLAVTEYTVTDMDALSDDLAALRNLVGEFGDLAMPSSVLGYRVSDFLTLTDSQVTRGGPRVGESRVSYS